MYEILPNIGCPRDFEKLIISKDVPGVIAYINESRGMHVDQLSMALFGLRVGHDYKIAKCYQNPNIKYIECRLVPGWGWLGSTNPIHDWEELSRFYRYWYVGFGNAIEMYEFINEHFDIIANTYNKNNKEV